MKKRVCTIDMVASGTYESSIARRAMRYPLLYMFFSSQL